MPCARYLLRTRIHLCIYLFLAFLLRPLQNILRTHLPFRTHPLISTHAILINGEPRVSRMRGGSLRGVPRVVLCGGVG